MRNIRRGIVTLLLLACCSVSPASAQVNIGIGLPNVSIGINLPLFPELVPIPGYPVYYAPRTAANYFFYDGMYWVYSDDYWYSSYWYNGPWMVVEPAFVPLFILRIPVRYYQQPPLYFRGWHRDAPPRWDQHWGREWEHQHRGWDKWKRGTSPRRAPLPVYQRQYAGDRYPRVEQQQDLHREHYRYQPRDKAVRQYIRQGDQRTSAPNRRERQDEPRMRSPESREIQRPAPHQQQIPDARRPQSQPDRPVYQERRPESRPESRREQRQEPRYEQRQEPRYEQRQQPRAQDREQRYQERERRQEPRGGQGPEQKRDEGRGRDRDN
ncbi:MAG: hypothetical protein RW306_14800 [Geobacteraceae bacterium]|nr:hypothetical protein [Geobacteraceae bacterium]